MSRILIAGGGGFGLEMYSYITSDKNFSELSNSSTVGILNDSSECEVLKKVPDAYYAGSINEYQPQSEDLVIIAIGNTSIRKKIFNLFKQRGARFMTFIHKTALVAETATIGEGSIICPYSIINAGAHIGENVAVNVFCSIGHGAQVGENSVLSPYCSLSGDSILGSGGFMGTRATLFPKVVLGEDCVVDAHSPAKQSTSARKIISSRGQYLVLDNRTAPRN